MVLSTSGPNLIALEQFAPNSPFIALTAPTNAKMQRICQKKVPLFNDRYHGNRTTYFLRQAEIGQQGSKEHVDRCRTMHDGLHDGRIKLLIYAPFYHY